MKRIISGRELELVVGDIAVQDVDAVVNAANSALAGGGGVDGAIHRAGGSAIMEETCKRYPDGCPTGSAVISGAGRMRAKYIIHAVGPFWNDGTRGEAQRLAGAYQSALDLAAAHDCSSVALPALSTGAYRYPLNEAAKVAVDSTVSFLERLNDESPMELVRFVLYSPDVLEVFERALEERLPS